MSDLRDQLCPSWCVLLPTHEGPHRALATQDDAHRTGCGCSSCGPPRRDPLTFEDDETQQLRRQLERALDQLERQAGAMCCLASTEMLLRMHGRPRG